MSFDAMILILGGIFLGAITRGYLARRHARRDLDDATLGHIVQVSRLHVQLDRAENSLALSRAEADHWQRRYRAASTAQRVDVYHHEALPGEEWKKGGE